MSHHSIGTIVVPTDFTHVLERAKEHAVLIAKKLNAGITFIHIAEDEKGKAASDAKLSTIAAETHAESGVECTYRTDVGSYFTLIGKVAAELGASYIVMGTHGIHGIQKLIGSYALRVISNSDIPFVVVQEKEAPSRYENIVLGLDFSKECKQKIAWAIKIAQTFDSKVHIIADYESDEFAAKAVALNVGWAQDYLSESGVEFTVTSLDRKSASLGKETIRYAVKINADLIVVMTHEDKGFAEFIFGAEEQYMIANEPQIPVMCFKAIDFTVNNSPLTAF